MQWERFFEDLDDRLDSEWEAERAALDTEAERVRLARLLLRERMVALSADRTRIVTAELVDGSAERGMLTAVGSDWAAFSEPGRDGVVVVPHAAIEAISMPLGDLLASARDANAGGAFAQRVTLGFVLRDLARRRLPVGLRAGGGRTYRGTIDRAGADHLDVALHDPDEARRATAVIGYRVVRLAALTAITVERDIPLV